MMRGIFSFFQDLKYVGCYEGPAYKWMKFLGKSGLGFDIEDCQQIATNSFKKYKLIGISDYECYGALEGIPQGTATSQACNGQRGYGDSVGVFEVVKQGVPQFEQLGCWADSRWSRALPKLLKYQYGGMSSSECFKLVTNANKVLTSEGKKPYVLFGVQVNSIKKRY